MTDMALYARSDGLLEPRSTKARDWVKKHSGQLTIADIKSDNRTSLQNRYLWGWVYEKQIVRKLNEAGITIKGIPWTKDIIHAVFQDKFLVKQEIEGKHKTIRVYESTANMSSKRFSEYINEQIVPFVQDAWGITIDDPREGYWLEIMKEMNQ